MLKTTSSARRGLLCLCLAIPGLLSGNEALDVLEGRKKASDVKLPPPAPGTPAAEAAQAKAPATFAPPAWAASPLDPVWARSVVFRDPGNPYVQQVALTGAFEWRAAAGDIDVDGVGTTPSANENVDTTRIRRARLGARMRAFYNTDVEATVELAGDSKHRGIERLSATTQLNEASSITYGKFRPTFTSEYAIDPQYLPTPDRSMLTNQLAPDSTAGVAFNHRRGDWDYGIGWFSSDSSSGFSKLEGDGLLALNLGHTTISGGSNPSRTRWHFDYIHNLDGAESGTRFDVAGKTSANGNQIVANNPVYRHLISAGISVEQERFSFLSDFMLARGDSKAWGMTVSPTYWVLPGTLKMVGRYHYADTEDPGGLITSIGASSDLEYDDSPFYTGDEYHSFYLGANLHLYQDQMILMAGLEHVILKDEAGGGFNTEATLWHAGARVSF